MEERQAPDVVSSRIMFSTAGVGGETITVSGTVSGTATTTTEIRSSVQMSPTPTGPVGLARMQNYEADLYVSLLFLSLSLLRADGKEWRDRSYFAPVAIGVPPQYMSCILDTGSADLWIASTNCSSLSGCSTTTPLYNTTLSSTRLDMNTTFSVKYGGGSASGEIWQDYVGFAGYNVSSQAFALIEDIDGDLLGQGISGLMGEHKLSLYATSSEALNFRCSR